MATKTIFVTSGTTFVLPSDWSNNNTIATIAAGSLGGINLSGGGGGAFASISNWAGGVGGATVNIQIGAGNSGTNTFFNSAGTVQAQAATANSQTPGLASGSTGSIKFSGGQGGLGFLCACPQVGGGGGGAGGPNGAGQNGQNGVCSAGGNGGAGNNGLGGGGGLGNSGVGGNGGNGTEYTATAGGTAGTGGGGGGGFSQGGNAGNYGGGVGGGGGTAAAPGLIVLMYIPSAINSASGLFVLP